LRDGCDATKQQHAKPVKRITANIVSSVLPYVSSRKLAAHPAREFESARWRLSCTQFDGNARESVHERSNNSMAGKNTAVFGIYRDRISVEEAVDNMRAAGFRNTDISVLFPDNQGSKDFAHEKHTKAPEGAATGAGSGALIGGTLGWLVGIGALAIPGIGPFVAAGPIVSLLAGVGAGGALGGIVGALVGMGIPEYEAKRYEGRIRSGGILLSVHCDNADWVRRAKEMLERTGAEDIASTGEAKADFSRADKPLPRKASQDESVVADRDRTPLSSTRTRREAPPVESRVEHPIATDVPPRRESVTDAPARTRTAGHGDPLDVTDEEVIVYDEDGNRVTRRR
jgi:hypothetical protein